METEKHIKNIQCVWFITTDWQLQHEAIWNLTWGKSGVKSEALFHHTQRRWQTEARSRVRETGNGRRTRWIILYCQSCPLSTKSCFTKMIQISTVLSKVLQSSCWADNFCLFTILSFITSLFCVFSSIFQVQQHWTLPSVLHYSHDMHNMHQNSLCCKSFRLLLGSFTCAVLKNTVGRKRLWTIWNFLVLHSKLVIKCHLKNRIVNTRGWNELPSKAVQAQPLKQIR